MSSICSDDPREVAVGGDNTRRHALFDFFINMAICNTVVVNPHPHSDRMNASGFVDDATAGSSYGHDSSTRSQGSKSSENHSNGLLLKVTNPTASPLPPLVGQTPVDYPSPRYGKINQTNGSLPHQDGLPAIIATDHETATGSGPDYNSEDDGLDDKKRPSTPTDGNEKAAGKDHTASDDSAQPRPTTLHLGRRLLQLPMLARSRLPPMGGKKSQANTPSVSPGYRNPVYEAESPDELALVYASAAYGFRLVKRHTNSITIELPNSDLLKFEILHILPFDSVRKRMSVIVKHPRSKKMFLYCKGKRFSVLRLGFGGDIAITLCLSGADASIMEALSSSFCESQRGQMYVYKTQEYLNLYASYGLRTLCLAKRVSLFISPR